MTCGVSRTAIKRLETEDNPKVLRLEEDQKYASVLLSSRRKEAAAKAQGYAKRVKQGRPRKGRKAAIEDVLQKCWACR
jgi:hypothetical protein